MFARVQIIILLLFGWIALTSETNYSIKSDSMEIRRGDIIKYKFSGNVIMESDTYIVYADSMINANDTLYFYMPKLIAGKDTINAVKGFIIDSVIVFEKNVRSSGDKEFVAEYMKIKNNKGILQNNIKLWKNEYIFLGNYAVSSDSQGFITDSACMIRKLDTVFSDTIYIQKNILRFCGKVIGKWGTGRLRGDSLFVDTTGYAIMYNGLFYTNTDSLYGVKLFLYGDNERTDSIYATGNAHIYSVTKEGIHDIYADSVFFYFEKDSLKRMKFIGDIKGEYKRRDNAKNGKVN